MNTLRDLLNLKGNTVWTVRADDTVLDAIRKMDDKDVGSVIVTEGDSPVGIFTERHYARKVFLKGRHSATTPIREVMEAQVICAHPDQTIEESMAVMTSKRIRHLPVLDGAKIIGIVSIGDLVKSKIADQEFTIEQLTEYIHGSSPLR